jgi:hypothetical protein
MLALSSSLDVMQRRKPVSAGNQSLAFQPIANHFID